MALESVKQCCLSITSEKVTERKNGKEKLCSLLNNKTIVATLNARPNDSFNWSQVFHSARKYFLTEAHKLEEEERSKPNPSQTVLRNRENQKRTAASLPLLILKKSCRATPHISAHLVIEAVFKVLNKRNSYLLENFAGEFLQVTLKFVLRFRHFYSEMTTENWRGLIKMCIWLYEQNITNVDPQSVVSVMAGVVRLCHTRGAQQLPPPHLQVLQHLPGFLRKALLSEKLAQQFSLHASLLKLLLSFTSAMACEWRQLLCRLGEDTFDAVLAMWDDRESPKQTHWLEYVCLMVTLHHPQKDGEVCEQSQFSADPSRWQRCLRHLYQLLHDHLARRISRGLTEGTGTNALLLPKPLLSLATRVCLQVFTSTENTGFIDVTQISSTANTSRDGGVSKRRKIEVGLVSLTDRLTSEGTLPHSLPWFQVVLSLLTEHPRFFDEGRCVMLLQALTQVLAMPWSDTVVQEMVLRCLSALSSQYSCVVVPQGGGAEHCGANPWAPVWDMTLRLVSGRQNSGPGLSLMGSLITTGLLVPESSAFELFHQSYLEVSQEALWTLLALVTTVPPPRHFKNEPAWLCNAQVKESRQMLVEYALPAPQTPAGSVGGSGVCGCPLECLRNPALLAKVLSCLCLRKPHNAQVNLKLFRNHHHHHHHHNLHHKSDNTSLITKLEEIYRLSTFTCDLPAAKVTQVTQPDPPSPTAGGGGGMKDLRTLPGEWDFVIKRVLAFSEQVEAENAHTSPESAEALIHFAELLLLLYVDTGDPRLEDKFHHVMQLISSYLGKLCTEAEASHWHTLHPILACLLHLFGGEQRSQEEEVKESPSQAAIDRRQHLLLSRTPAGLFTAVLILLERRSVKVAAAAAASGTTLLRGNSMNQASIDDFDFDFDGSIPSTSEAAKEEMFDFEDELSNKVEEDQSENVTVDDPTTFSPRDRCVALAGHWLACAAPIAPDGTKHDSFLHKAVDHFLQLSSTPGLDMSDVAVLLTFVHSLFTAEYCDDCIHDGLQVISSVAKVHCSLSQVARCSINSLAELIRRHGSSLSSGVRTSLLTLVKAFTIKHHQGTYGTSVTQALFSVNVELTRLDPRREWSRYEVPQHEHCGKIHSLLSGTDHELRVRAAAATHLLLVTQDARQLDAHHQDCVFEEVYRMVLQTLTVLDLPSEEMALDEKGNRVSSFLLALGTMALCSPYLEGKALFALCLSVPSEGMKVSLLLQLLSCLARSRGTTPKALLVTNLPYLATHWVQHGHQITGFPTAAFGYAAMEAFLAENRVALLPILLESDQRTSIDVLAESCGKDAKELFVEAFPALMARIFPYIAAEQATAEGCQLPETKIQAGKRQYKQVERTLGTESFSSLLTAHVGEVTLRLLCLVHEPDPWVEGEVVVPPPPPTFTPRVIHATLDFVGGIFRQDGLLLVFLSGRRQELHRVLQGLLECLALSAEPHVARSALAAAAVLLEAVLPHLSSQLAHVSHYLLRMLLHLFTCRLAQLGRLGRHLSHRCVDLLHRLLAATLRYLPSHLAPAVAMLFGRLLPVVAWPGVPGLLHLLLDCDHPDVRVALAGLPALPQEPDGPALAGLRDKHRCVVAACRGQPDLADEVDNFLCVPVEAVASHHLSHLAAVVQSSRGQVAELFLGSGPGQESRGHRLAHRLMALAAGGASSEACRCLGELGPLSLGTPVFLLSDDGPGQPVEEDGVDLVYVERILLALNNCLTCGVVEVERVAGQAMVGVFTTQEGHSACEILPPTTMRELRPLVPEVRPRAKAASSTARVDAAAYRQIVGDEALWLGGAGYEAWVCGLAAALVTGGCGRDLASHLLPVCALRPDFSALLLPFLVHSALKTDSGGRRDVLSRQFSAFFARHGEAGPSEAPASHDKSAIQALLAVVDYLRLQRPQRSLQGRWATATGTSFDSNLWLQLNYLHVVRAAHYCGAHFSALLYLHLHHQHMLHHMPPETGQAAITRRLQAPPMARVVGHHEAEAASRLLLEVHGSLGDGAGVEGCLAAGAMAPDAPAARLLRCRHQGKWLSGLAVCDAAEQRTGLLEGLASLGLYNTLASVLAGSPRTDHTTQAQWQAAWRLCRWQDQLQDRQLGGGSGGGGGGGGEQFHQHLFAALHSLHHQDTPALQHHTYLARHSITQTLKLSRAESTSLVYPIMAQMQVLNEVEEAARCLGNLSDPEKVRRHILDLEELWTVKEGMGTVEYKYKEEVLAARVSSLKALSSVCKNEALERLLHKTLLAKSKLARGVVREGDKASHSLVGAESAILWASQLAVTPALTRLTRLEEAEVARAAGDVQRARYILQDLLTQMEDHHHQQEQQERGYLQVLSQALTLQGELLMDARCLPPHTVIQEYFNHSTTMLLTHAQDKESREVLENSHQRLAQHVDQLYRQVHNHLESDGSQAKRANIRQSQEEVAKLTNLLRGCRENTNDWKELKKKSVLLQRNINIDQEFLREQECEKQQYLAIALKAYLDCLAITSSHDLHTYRVAALWLENAEEEEINKMVSEVGSRVKSHHFVPLLYQLVARLSTHSIHQPTSFSSVLFQLLMRVCEEHPHHGLPVIFALAHAHADHHLLATGRAKKAAAEVTEEFQR